MINFRHNLFASLFKRLGVDNYVPVLRGLHEIFRDSILFHPDLEYFMLVVTCYFSRAVGQGGVRTEWLSLVISGLGDYRKTYFARIIFEAVCQPIASQHFTVSHKLKTKEEAVAMVRHNPRCQAWQVVKKFFQIACSRCESEVISIVSRRGWYPDRNPVEELFVCTSLEYTNKKFFYRVSIRVPTSSTDYRNNFTLTP